jgi:prolyl-tRNA synthetase family I
MKSGKTKHEMGITVSKTDNFSSWYQQIVTKAGLIEYYDVAGCYILLPNSYSIWEKLQNHLDRNFKDRGVQNAYFPLLITRRNLEREKEHIAGFQPEVAWINKFKDDDGNDMDDIAIRPTSECAIYSIYPKLIRSYVDLPLKYNQWCNIVRWEFKDTTPFIRSREFLWNEGHTCFADKDQALEEVKDIINLYSNTYRDILAVPTIVGIKTDIEKFAGADATYTAESFIQEAGKGIQCCTAHTLGQNFSKMFNIRYQDEDGTNKFVWQNSWGFSTRSIGVMIMTHGDDKGVIIPPKASALQIVVIPIFYAKSKEIVDQHVKDLEDDLNSNVELRYKVDDSNHNPGWKFNYWETLGVPLRIEVGPKNVSEGNVLAVRRDTGEKILIECDGKLVTKIGDLLEDIQNNLYNQAHQRLLESLDKPNTWEEFRTSIENKKMCLVKWCKNSYCELGIKDKTGAKSLCIPLREEYKLSIEDDSLCIHCEQKANTTCLFARSF